MLRYGPTVFLSAFLLFQVQPLMGRYVLPWFGGTPAVWTACVLFFQSLLLAGYAYAYALGRLPAGRAAAVHAGLVLVSLFFCYVAPDPSLKPAPADDPTPQILGVLLRSVGLPYLVVSTTGPLMQAWFAREFPGRSPYRLYALSNLGSLLALLSYPFVFERLLGLTAQARWWSVGYAAFAVLTLVNAWSAARRPAAGAVAAPAGGAADDTKPGFTDVVLWLLLAAAGSTLLLAATNQMCQDVAVVPFLWVLPLALYLLSFILTFEFDRVYHPAYWLPWLAVAFALAVGVLGEGVQAPIVAQLAILAAAVFVGCTVCHGELAALKPAPRHLTGFYLAVATGGWLGGVLVGVVAPRVFRNYLELPLSLVAVGTLFVAAQLRKPAFMAWGGAVPTLGALCVALGGLGAAVALQQTADTRQPLHRSRNFYGVLRVLPGVDGRAGTRQLLHGRIEHGFQYTDTARRVWPTSYYGVPSGIGLVMSRHPKRVEAERSGQAGGFRLGAVGLGCGTVAAYANEGDAVRFYEIDPDVKALSEPVAGARGRGSLFTFLDDARGRGASVEVVLGDGRVTLERELAAGGEGQRFDALVVDAFSSDAIPVHLLTQECGQVYRRHLAPGGVLCFHISNRFLDLEPVCRALGDSLRFSAVKVYNVAYADKGVHEGTWVLLTDNRAFLADPAVKGAAAEWNTEEFAKGTGGRPGPEKLLWTDDYSSLDAILDVKPGDWAKAGEQAAGWFRRLVPGR